MKFKSLALLAVLSMSSVYGAGGESGGGGGGICTPKKCMTLAQAGLRIDETRTAYFELDQEVIDEAKKIINSINVLGFNKGSFLSGIVGSKETYKIVNENEVKKFAKFKKEYLALMKENSADAQGFELLAVSQGYSRTYLLPGFDRLDVRGKALLLIHEVLVKRLNINGKGSLKTIKDVLQFDGVLIDYLKSIEEGASFDEWKLIEVMYNVSLIQGNAQNVELIASLIRKFGPQATADICKEIGEVTSTEDSNFYCRISHEQSLALRTLHVDAAQKLSSESFRLWAFKVSKLKSLLEYNLIQAKGLETTKQMIKICEDNKGSDILAIVKIKGSDQIVRLDCGK